MAFFLTSYYKINPKKFYDKHEGLCLALFAILIGLIVALLGAIANQYVENKRIKYPDCKTYTQGCYPPCKERWVQK